MLTGSPVIDRFLSQVKHHADLPAIWEGQQFLSYGDLYQRAVHVASYLNEFAAEESFIGVYHTGEWPDYVHILGVLLSGKCYVPLSHELPASRIQLVCQKVKLNYLLCSSPIESLSEQIICITPQDIERHTSSHFSLPSITPSSSAYLLFTSGTSGEPKGVMIQHDHLNHCFDYFLKNFDWQPSDHFLQVYDLSFDVSVFSFLFPLQIGSCSYILPQKGIKPLNIIRMLKQHPITTVSMVPGSLQALRRYFKEIELPQLRYSFFSGDALYADIASEWQNCIPNAEIHNFYGPTETTIVCSHIPIPKEFNSEEAILPLGKLFPNMDYFVDQDAVLWVHGPQVIDHYFQNAHPELFTTKSGKVFYNTGDRVKEENEVLHFLGRSDSQVKIKGYRVELKEIEAVVRKQLGIPSIALADQQHLYLFLENDQSAKVRKVLAQQLPKYMIPDKIIVCGPFPLNKNEKVDVPLLQKWIRQPDLPLF